MSKVKSLFVTFEGIEGSGKTYQSKKLFKSLVKKKIQVVLTREPGGSKSAEEIRKIILTGSKNKFTKNTDTLLYLAARNEHIVNKLKPEILKKKNIICDRYIDLTLAYQVYGKGVNEKFVENIHKEILGNVKPDFTFVLTVNIKKAFERIKKRKIKNRYDKFSLNFYKKVQNAFIKIAKKNKRKYLILNNSTDTTEVEQVILKKFIKLLN